MKFVTPSVRETAFNCQHSGVLANQTWGELSGKWRNSKSPLPSMLISGGPIPDFSEVPDAAVRKQLITWAEALISGIPFFENKSKAETWMILNNINISSCFDCKTQAFR